MVGHLDHMWIKFEYQGHHIKIMVTLVKLIILIVEHQILLLWPTYGININLWRSRSSQGHGHLRVGSFQNHIASVWISIQKRAVGFRPNAFLWLLCEHLLPKFTFGFTLLLTGLLMHPNIGWSKYVHLPPEKYSKTTN